MKQPNSYCCVALGKIQMVFQAMFLVAALSTSSSQGQSLPPGTTIPARLQNTLNGKKEVLKRLRVRSTLIGAVINLIHERAETVNVHASFEISPDPKDDPFCLCSEEGNADFIVTLNPKDFPQERLRAKVISPEAMA